MWWLAGSLADCFVYSFSKSIVDIGLPLSLYPVGLFLEAHFVDPLKWCIQERRQLVGQVGLFRRVVLLRLSLRGVRTEILGCSFVFEWLCLLLLR